MLRITLALMLLANSVCAQSIDSFDDGKKEDGVLAVVCNTEHQIRSVMEAFREDTEKGRRVLNEWRATQEIDPVMRVNDGACDEIVMPGIVVKQMLTTEPTTIYRSDGKGTVEVYLLEVHPIVNRIQAQGTYFIMAREFPSRGS